MSRKKPTPRKPRSFAHASLLLGEKRYLAVSLLLINTLFCHGLILTNDGTIWDSWYVLNWLQHKNWTALHEFFDSVGMPLYGWIYRPFAYSSDIVGAFMLATVFCLFCQALIVYLLGQKLGGLKSGEALCIALLSQAMPTFTAGQDFIMFFFVFTYTIFLLAALLATSAVGTVGMRAFGIRLAAITLFLVSFYNAALLVFYGGFFLLLYFQYRRIKPMSFWGGARHFASSHFDFFILPPLAWMLRHTFSPQFGWYETYNSPTENIPIIIPSLVSFIQNVIPFQVFQLSRWLLVNPVIVIMLAVAALACVKFAPRTWEIRRGPPLSFPMIAFGLVLLLFAVFPFAAAGKYFSPAPMGEPSRYTILTGLPLAILLYGAIRLAVFSGQSTTSRCIVPITGALVIILGCQIPPSYIEERAEWIFSRSILANAVNNKEVQRSSVIVLQNCGMTGQIIYGIHAFASAFGSPTRLVTPIPPNNRQYFTPSEIALTLLRTTNLPNDLNRVNPAGQQILLMANRNREGLSDWQIVKKYLKNRYFRAPTDMEAFLRGLTTLNTAVLKSETVLLPALADINSIPSSNQLPTGTFTNSIGMEMVSIPGGWWVAKYETLQKQFIALMNNNPSLFLDPNRPVERVSWTEADKFCKQLTEIEREAGRLPGGFVYRLPSIKEFEFLVSETPLSDGVTASRELYWHTQVAGSLQPNQFGIYDLVGNVWEWTSDWSDSSKRMKVSLGGAWENYENELIPYSGKTKGMDSYSRTLIKRLFGPQRRDYPDQAFWDRGFRCILSKEISR